MMSLTSCFAQSNQERLMYAQKIHHPNTNQPVSNKSPENSQSPLTRAALSASPNSKPKPAATVKKSMAKNMPSKLDDIFVGVPSDDAALLGISVQEPKRSSLAKAIKTLLKRNRNC